MGAPLLLQTFRFCAKPRSSLLFTTRCGYQKFSSIATTMAAEQRLANKTALVTGGSAGFGLAISTLFANHGCSVIIADLNPPSSSTTSQNVKYIKHDVTSASAWDSLLQQIQSPIDILVNNAGTSYKNRPTAEVTEADFDRVFGVNVKGIFLGVQSVMPGMVQAGKGVVINIASVGALRPRKGLVWYNSSKGAVVNATKGLAAEYGPAGIRVNAVCPLLAATGLFESFVGVPATKENIDKFASEIPLQRLCTPEDVANGCLFLASDEAKFITGIALEVDGGRAI